MPLTIPPPSHLRCEFLTNPLGIGTPRPRLSWFLSHQERGQLQSAYRIIVSSDQANCREGETDVWDTGRVSSGEIAGVEYDGPDLRSSQRYYWRVQWWDLGHRASEWSDAAWFEMGLLEGKDWKGKWIAGREWKEFRSKGSVLLGEPLGDYVNAFAMYLRCEFSLPKPVASARAYISGLGYYELRINGRKIGDRVLDPGQTDYRASALYSTYDVTSEISAGTGRTCAVGILLGNGRCIRSYGYGQPKALLQLIAVYEDGAKESFQTDRAWKASYGPLQENGLYYGEKYDARLEMPGWDQPGFDDKRWSSVAEVEGPRLAAQAFPPIRVTASLSPVSRHELPGGSFLFDFGQNFTGWVKLTVAGERGTAVKLRHGELLNEDGSLNTSPNQNAEATDVYVLKGGGDESYEPRFTYHGFRYVEISASPAIPEIRSVIGCFVHTDVEETGSFDCSNNLLNRIHKNIRWGQLSNLMSIPTDCTQRDERQGWLGDAHLAAEESMFNFDMAAFYEKFLDDIRVAQKEDGSLPDTVPAYLGRLYPADPAWSAAYITIAWLQYQFYADRRILERHFDAMRRYISFLQSAAEGYIIRRLGKYGDWCPPGSIAPKRTPVELTSTWYFYHDTVLLSKIAAVLQKEASHRELQELASRIKDAFNEAFLKDGEYAVNRFAPVDWTPGQTSNALPLYLAMVPPDQKDHVLNRLIHGVVNEQDYHLDTGILGTRYLLDVLTDNGHAEIAYRVASQRSYPGWGYMVEEGATTLWERWELITGGGMNSHNHIMLGSVDAWFYRVVGGISCALPGWKEIRIRPLIVPGLEYAQVSLRTVSGHVAVSWRRSDDTLTLDVTVPVGASATVEIPRLWPHQSVREGGELVWGEGTPLEAARQKGLVCAVYDHGIVVRVGSGTYDFETTTDARSGSQSSAKPMRG